MANRKLRSSAVVNIEDLRRLAQRRVPRAVFDYLDGGADAEVTLAENCRAFRDTTFRPRNGVAAYNCKTSVSVLGQEIAFPAILAPVSYIRLMHADGEAGVARAAGQAGTIYALPTISGHTLEAVKAASSGPLWYQLYLIGGRAAAEGAIDRARRAGYSALVLTVDTPASGNRERDPRSGMKELLAPALLLQGALSSQHPRPSPLACVVSARWRYSKDGKCCDSRKGSDGPGRCGALRSLTRERAGKTCAGFARCGRARSSPRGFLPATMPGALWMKALPPVVVSNHGGRQLDCVSASLDALPEVVDAVGGQVEVLMDGGVRRGADIAKALCLGARAVLIGRAYAYGLAAAGEAGVARAIKILKDDLDLTLTLLGCPSIDQLDASYLGAPRRR